MPEVNWLAVVAATIATFVVGGVWYSPLLFAKAWQREAGVSDDRLQGRNMAIVFGGAFALMFVAATVFAFFLGPNQTIAFGAATGLAAGLGWVASALGVVYLFERRSLKLWLINGGYDVVAFTVIGTVIGAID